MTDKKLTDNEIVKALECCVNKTDVFVSYHIADTREYAKITIKDILGVINRLKEKNSNLTSDLTSLQKDLTSLQAENERLSNFVTEERCREIAREMIPKFVGQAKAEAYKEFAELVQSHLENYPYDERVRIDYVISLIRKKEKEMAGEDNAGAI